MGDRLPLNQMPPDELVTWLEQTRSRLQDHMRWEQRYLEKRAQNGMSTQTDRFGNEGLVVERDVLGLLDELLDVAREHREGVL